jgi:hypothetical protein
LRSRTVERNAWKLAARQRVADPVSCIQWAGVLADWYLSIVS